MNLKRTIFVGSSHEGHAEAVLTCAVLKGCDATLDPQIWSLFFDVGSLTFEALEEMLAQCCAAVFVLRKDDVVHHIPPEVSVSHTGTIAPNEEGSQAAQPAIRPTHPDPGPIPLAPNAPPVGKHPRTAARNKPIYMPRGNVLLEFGLVAGRLGRRNVALCVFDKVELPSDLAGMTVIDMSCDADSDHKRSNTDPPDEPHVKLKRWASHLLPTAESIPRTAVFHGYTGQWNFELRLSKWRSVLLNPQSYALVNGSLDLFISSEGEAGYGWAYGAVSYLLNLPSEGESQASGRYSGDLQMTHEVRNVDCQADGSVQFMSHLQGMHAIPTKGQAWPDLQGPYTSEPWTFKWTLKPTDRPNEMEGTVMTNASGGTEGTIVAKKRRIC